MKTMIENQTPYLGKVKFRFQKSPNYIGKSILNQVHLDLGFVKLVSRVFPEKDKNGWTGQEITVTTDTRLTESNSSGSGSSVSNWSGSGTESETPRRMLSHKNMASLEMAFLFLDQMTSFCLSITN